LTTRCECTRKGVWWHINTLYAPVKSDHQAETQLSNTRATQLLTTLHRIPSYNTNMTRTLILFGAGPGIGNVTSTPSLPPPSPLTQPPARSRKVRLHRHPTHHPPRPQHPTSPSLRRPLRLPSLSQRQSRHPASRPRRPVFHPQRPAATRRSDARRRRRSRVLQCSKDKAE